MNKKVYITGCLGFIGSHITKKCLQLGFDVIGVDVVSYSSNQVFIKKFLLYPNFKFIRRDINDLDEIDDCDYVINTAAETHVDNSIVNSSNFVRSNIDGVHHLLRIIKNKKSKPIFLHFSTDEVYGDISDGSFTESSLLKPSNPYSATKAAADMLILAWFRTFTVPYLIVRPTNNYGLWQHPEKLIPKSCECLRLGTKIPLHMRGLAKRTWLNVEDTADAIIHLIQKGLINEIFNISGNFEDFNINVVKQIILYYNQDPDYIKYIDFSVQRPGVDVRYHINDDKLRNTGWANTRNFYDELPSIVEFYRRQDG